MGNTTTIKLSNNKEVEVNRLGLFGIQDNVAQPDLSPYTVTILFANGEIYEQPFDLTVERIAPETPFEQCEENSQDWLMWREYHRWQNGIVYEQKRANAYADYCYQVARYIRSSAVIGELGDDITVEDWHAITEAALCHTVTPDDVAKAIKQLNATYHDEPLMDAYKDTSKSGLSYDYRKVELDLMVKLGETEEQYFSRSVMERARLIASQQIDAMGEALEHKSAMDAAKANG